MACPYLSRFYQSSILVRSGFFSLMLTLIKVLALKHFIVHKKDFDSLLASSGSSLSTKKFLRMISFTLIDILINFPVLLTEFTMEIVFKEVKPYTSWEVIHSQFSRVSEYPLYALNSPSGRKFLVLAELSLWMLCISGILFFILFGFSVDARADYVKAHRKIKSIIWPSSRRESETRYVQ